MRLEARCFGARCAAPRLRQAAALTCVTAAVAWTMLSSTPVLAGVAAAENTTASAVEHATASPSTPLPPRALSDSLAPTDTLRVHPSNDLIVSPGQVSGLDLAPFRADATDLSTVLNRLPGLFVRRSGSLGNYSSVSIRGSTAAQVGIYLDGVPLSRAGLGVTNLADLPFAALDRIEVYRGFAPPGLGSGGIGGAVHLVTRAPRGRTWDGAATVAGGSFGTQRLGFSQQVPLTPVWNVLLLGDFVRTAGDFAYLDDNCTAPYNTADDTWTERSNNWMHGDELFAKVGGVVGRSTRVDITHQHVARRRGVPGLVPCDQAVHAQLSSTHELTSLQLGFPSVWARRLSWSARVYHDWRRDTYEDHDNEVGLGKQHNRDETRAVGAHVEALARLPLAQHLGVYFDARDESFLPWRGYPTVPFDPPEQRGPKQRRTTLEATLENRVRLAGTRVQLQGLVHWTHENDLFEGTLRTPYSRRPAAGGRRDYVEPRFGVRLRLMTGVHVDASYAHQHRSPGFLELFGDGGAVAGSSDLVAEEGRSGDVALDLRRAWGALRWHASLAHFRKRVDNLITFLPQSQSTFVARNIGAARMDGEELVCGLSLSRGRTTYTLDGNYTRQRTEDLGVDRTWYAGNVLPGRPERQLFVRVGARFDVVTLGYEYEHVGMNYLDRLNRDVVEQRGLHGVDVTLGVRRLSLRAVVRNLTDNRTRDIAGFPLPGRTFSLSTQVRY